MPDTQKQENSSDCGVFAIAFLTELIINKFNTNFSSIRFDISKMRAHLLNCLIEDKLTVFPKVEKMPKMPCKDDKTNIIKLYCICKMPDLVDNMIKCGNKFCKIKWYHESCSGCADNNGKWLCNKCSW
jgi:hypothetical protein